MFQPKAGVTEIIVRRLVDFPVLRNGKEDSAAWVQHASHFAERAGGIANVFEGHDIDGGIERAVAKRQGAEIADYIEVRVVPRRVADAQVHRDVALIREQSPMPGLARAGIEYPRARRQGIRKSRKRAFDQAFEKEHVVAQRTGKARCQASGSHATLRASIMTLDPFPNRASIRVKGTAAATMPR